MQFHRFLPAKPSAACTPFLLRCLSLFSGRVFHDKMIKAIIYPIQELSHVVAEQVTINFLQWRRLRPVLELRLHFVVSFYFKCIFHKWLYACSNGTHGHAHNSFDTPQWGPRAVSQQASGALRVVTNCSRWQLNDDGKLHHVSYTFKCIHINMLMAYKAKTLVSSQDVDYTSWHQLFKIVNYVEFKQKTGTLYPKCLLEHDYSHGAWKKQ